MKALKVTVLDTMLAGDLGRGIGEWGFAAVIEVDGQRLLFDTGQRPETVLHNARELGIDLSGITDVVITHNHGDHTAGLVTLRREMAKKNPKALSRVHVARGVFDRRPGPNGADGNGLLPFKAAYEALGGAFVEHAAPVQLLPSVWFTGPVPRTHPERNWGVSGRVQTSARLVEDNVPEDASVIVDTVDGLVAISGCAHAGVINTLEYARKVVRPAPVIAAIGGFHLFAASDESAAVDRDEAEGARRSAVARRALHRHRSAVSLARDTGLEPEDGGRRRGGLVFYSPRRYSRSGHRRMTCRYIALSASVG